MLAKKFPAAAVARLSESNPAPAEAKVATAAKSLNSEAPMKISPSGCGVSPDHH
jgi:hypothetical protein